MTFPAVPTETAGLTEERIAEIEQWAKRARNEAGAVYTAQMLEDLLADRARSLDRERQLRDRIEAATAALRGLLGSDQK